MFQNHKFFFAIIYKLRDTYEIIFTSRRPSRPKCKAYRDFKEKWGFIGTIYDVAEKKIEEIEKINQMYLSDFFQLLTYMIDESVANEEQDKFDEQRRKAMKGR